MLITVFYQLVTKASPSYKGHRNYIKAYLKRLLIAARILLQILLFLTVILLILFGLTENLKVFINLSSKSLKKLLTINMVKKSFVLILLLNTTI